MLFLLFLISWFSATISGIAGFGGALILLPIITNTYGVKVAVPILTIAQLSGNFSRFWFSRKEVKWKPIIYFSTSSIPFAILGSYLFVYIPNHFLFKIIGIFLISIVIFRQFKTKNKKSHEKGLILGGSITGFLSGLVGSAGPLGAAFFLNLNLSAGAYISSEAVSALTMHIIKIVIYQKYSLINLSVLLNGLFLSIGIVLGSWTGKKIIQKMPKQLFIRFVEILLILSALHLILFK